MPVTKLGGKGVHSDTSPSPLYRPNYVEPGKRPQSSTTPTIIVDPSGRVKMVVGASGGSRITTAVAQVSFMCSGWVHTYTHTHCKQTGKHSVHA